MINLTSPADDEDSLTITGAGDQLDEEEDDDVIHPPVEETIDLNMVKKNPTTSGQDPISSAVLRPVVSVISVDDPLWKARGKTHHRKAVCFRVTVPSEAQPSSLRPHIVPSRNQVTLHYHTAPSLLDAEYTAGKKLAAVPNVLNGFEETIGERRKEIQQQGNAADGGVIIERLKHTINSPLKLEKLFRNPFKKWDFADVNELGYLKRIAKRDASYYYCFVFAEEADDAAVPGVITSGYMGVDDSDEDSELDPEAIALANLQAERAINNRRTPHRTPRRTPHHRTPAYDISDAMSLMTIDTAAKSTPAKSTPAKSTHSRTAADRTPAAVAPRIPGESNREYLERLLEEEKALEEFESRPATGPGAVGPGVAAPKVSSESSAADAGFQVPQKSPRNIPGYDPRVTAVDDEDDEWFSPSKEGGDEEGSRASRSGRGDRDVNDFDALGNY